MGESPQISDSTLPVSRLYTFIDGPREFALYFLEGQRLIEELALLHGVNGPGFSYFRDVVLSVQPMIALLKHGEQLGFYIDSTDPEFRLKVEAGHHGATRCMVVPQNFGEFPSALHGVARVQKLFPNNRPPYQSVIQLDGLPLGEVVNLVLRDSYQTNSAMIVSQQSDQSMLLHQLPPLRDEEYDYSLESVRRRRDGIRDQASAIFERALLQPEEIAAAFQQIGFRLLASRPVEFRCSCSQERVIQGLRPIYLERKSDLFDPGQESIEVTCEYCKTQYAVSRAELDEAANPIN